jgi:large subunit ribosomal protein L24
MQIKKDDTVVVIAGKDKGKTGTVLRTIPKKNKVVVEGVNMQTKHARATRTSSSEIKHMEGPIDVSNVMFYDKDAKAATRIGHEVKDGKKVRVSKKTGKAID